MSVHQVRGARRKILQRYGAAPRVHRSVQDSIAAERQRAAKEMSAKKKK